MTKRERERAQMQRHPPVGWQMIFMRKPGSSYREMCVICGSSGIGSYGHAYPLGWQVSCLMGHPYECEGCGAKFSSGMGLSGHRQCKSGHGDCCSCHVSTNHSRLQAVLAATR